MTKTPFHIQDPVKRAEIEAKDAELFEEKKKHYAFQKLRDTGNLSQEDILEWNSVREKIRRLESELAELTKDLPKKVSDANKPKS